MLFFLQKLSERKQKILDKNLEDLTIGEKIKRLSIDENFTWEHVYDLMMIKFLKWWDLFLLKLPNILIGLFVFFLFALFAKYTGRLIYRLMKQRVKQESIKQIVVKIFKATVLLIGFLVFLIILDLGTILTSILGLAGVASLAVGLAVQGTLHNTFSGVIISFLPDLKIGDWVETDGIEGTVSEINLRSVQILKSDNNYVMIPNSKILDNPFTNYTLTKRTRVSLECGIAYNSDMRKVMQITKKRFSEVFPQNKNETVDFFFDEFDDSSINFKVRFWGDAINKGEELALKHTAMLTLKELFDENNITIPFPMRTIEILSSEEK